GHTNRAVQRSVVPCWAPAIEYVAIPDGSSSAAPVITPGPSADKNRRNKFGFFVLLAITFRGSHNREHITLMLLAPAGFAKRLANLSQSRAETCKPRRAFRRRSLPV